MESLTIMMKFSPSPKKLLRFDDVVIYGECSQIRVVMLTDC